MGKCCKKKPPCKDCPKLRKKKKKGVSTGEQPVVFVNRRL